MKKFVKLLVTIFILFTLVLFVGCESETVVKEEAKKLYVVCIQNNGEENLKMEVTDIATFELPSITKEGHKLLKWCSDEELKEDFYLDDYDLASLTQDITVFAYAKWKVESYTVIFKIDGEAVSSQKIPYGKAANVPTVPEKSGYNFDGWDGDISFIKGDTTFNAVFSERPLEIKYYNLNTGEEITGLTPVTYERRQTVELPVPELSGYEFIGWFLSEISLTPYTALGTTFDQDLKLYARFTETVRHNPLVLPDATYRITEIKKVPNGSGTYVYQPVIPTGAPSGLTNYTWSSSNKDIAEQSEYSSIKCRGLGYCVITGTNKTDTSITINCVLKVTAEGPVLSSVDEANTIITHTVTFKDNAGQIIKTQVVEDGHYALYPIAPVLEGYSFTGWDKQNYNIKEDTVITATYKKGGENNYQGKKIAIIGDSITTMYNYIPDGFSFFYPYPTGDTYDVNATWWMQTINRLGGQLFVDNAYSGSCVVGKGYATNTDLRLSYTQIAGQSPDVIIIYMGSNDGHAKYTTFKDDYKTMIEKLQKMCPNAEIVVMELAKSYLYTDEIKDSYNTSINEIATEYGLTVVHTGTLDLKPYLIDSAHPYTEGMNAMADVIISELTK